MNTRQGWTKEDMSTPAHERDTKKLWKNPPNINQFSIAGMREDTGRGGHVHLSTPDKRRSTKP